MAGRANSAVIATLPRLKVCGDWKQKKKKRRGRRQRVKLKKDTAKQEEKDTSKQEDLQVGATTIPTTTNQEAVQVSVEKSWWVEVWENDPDAMLPSEFIMWMTAFGGFVYIFLK